MIWIRADANREIGAGHLMRCLAVAGALERRGQQVCFLTADEEAGKLLAERGKTFRVLHTDYRHMEEELPRLRKLLGGELESFFLVDSYQATPEYLEEAGKLARTGYVDDMGRGNLPVDVLINYNIYAGELSYEGLKPDARRLLGMEYVPLRQEFASVKYQVREQAGQVLVTTGGSDKYNLAGKLLERALAWGETKNLRYVVVSGAFNVHLPALREIQEKHGNVKICCNVQNMSELMQESDIAVSAGGSTMYELGAVGVPAVCFSFVDNQERIVEGFVKNRMACFGGNYLRQGENMLDGAVEYVARLAADSRLRREYSSRQRSLVDGQGADRIARALEAECRGGKEKDRAVCRMENGV